MTEISMDKQYQTRDGREVRILCTDGPDPDYPVCGFIGSSLAQWTRTGRFPLSLPGEHRGDLVEVPEEITLEGWVNVYGNDIILHDSKYEADVNALDDVRIACVPVTITFKRGDGLDD